MRGGQRGSIQIILIVVLVILFGIITFYLVVTRGKFVAINIPSATPQESSKPAQATPTPAPSESSVTSIDDTWSRYTNNTQGFSIKIPKNSPELGGACSNGKLEVGVVPVKVFDDNQGAYITYEYFYEYPVNNACQKTTTDLAVIQQRANQWKSGGGNKLFVPGNWHIITTKVENSTQLEQFIKDNYGTGCKLGAMTLSQTGDYDVKIVGDGLDLEATKCPVNFMLAIKYSPEFKKAATWSIGQDIVFSSPGYKEAYDPEMVNSFKFIK